MRCLLPICGGALMPDKIDLAYAMGLEPKLAVDYFRAKGYAVTWNWQEALHAAHARAFTVAKAVRMDVLETIRDEVDKALSQGLTGRAFEKALMPRLKALGWWGRQVVVGTDGQAEVVQLGSPHRLRTIYQTNLQTAYQSGRYAQQLANADSQPYWQYIAVMDSRTRPAHAALNGRVFRYDDPIWESHYPPNGWGCRCRVRAMGQRRLDSLGLSVSDSQGHLSTRQVDAGLDKRSGEVTQVDVTTWKDGKLNFTPDPGWSYNPGVAAFGADQSVARKLVSLQNRNLRQQVIQTLNNNPSRQLAFSDWVEQVLTARRPGHGVASVGVMTDEVATQVATRTGAEPARLMVIGEKQLVHADSAKHQRMGVALTVAEYQKLPTLLASPSAVLWDNRNQNLLYIGGSDDAVKVAINAPQKLPKQKDLLDVAINVYRVNYRDLQNGVANGQYEVLAGEIKAL